MKAGVGFVVLILLPAIAVAQEPTVKLPVVSPPAAQLPPPEQKKPKTKLPAVDPSAKLPAIAPSPKNIKNVVLTAHLEGRLPGARTVRVGPVRWSCRGDACTTTGYSGKPPTVDACLALRRQVGAVKSFGDRRSWLSPAELQRCNNRPPRDPQGGPVVFGDDPPVENLPVARPTPKPAGGAGGERVPTDIEIPAPGFRKLGDLDELVLEPPGPELHLPAVELAIIDVRRVAGPDPIHLNDVVPVQVVVRNFGLAPATVRAGVPSGRRGETLRYGRVRVINPLSPAILPLEVVAAAGNIRGDELRTTVLLFNPPRTDEDDLPFGGLFGDPFRDGNNANNAFRVSFPVERPPTYDVVASLDHMRIRDDCDNVSDGEWIVLFGITEFRDGASVQSEGSYWPSRNDPGSVSSGTTEILNRSIRLSGVSEGSMLRVEVSAVDCDGDATTGLALLLGPWASPVECAREEDFFEVSGDNDNAGVLFFEMGPDDWQGEIPSPLVSTAWRDTNECSGRSHAFLPTVRLSVVPR